MATGIIKDCKATSYKSIKDNINAGANWRTPRS
jgi:hypothetical protein